jgi:hypothetical protein
MRCGMHNLYFLQPADAAYQDAWTTGAIRSFWAKIQVNSRTAHLKALQIYRSI